MVANVEIDSLLESALSGWITPNFLAFHFSAPAVAACFTCYVTTLKVDYHALLHTSPMDGNKYNFFLSVFFDDWITSYFIILKKSHSTDVFLLLLIIPTTSCSQSDSLLVSCGLRSSRNDTVTHECPAAYNYFGTFVWITFCLSFSDLVFCFLWPGCSCGSCHSPGSNTVIK